MGLARCPDCGREVSDQATSCPQCGRPMATRAAPIAARPEDTPLERWGCKYPLFAVVGFLLLLILVGLCSR